MTTLRGDHVEKERHFVGLCFTCTPVAEQARNKSMPVIFCFPLILFQFFELGQKALSLTRHFAAYILMTLYFLQSWACYSFLTLRQRDKTKQYLPIGVKRQPCFGPETVSDCRKNCRLCAQLCIPLVRPAWRTRKRWPPATAAR